MSGWWFVFVLMWLMLLFVVGVRFEKTCTVSGKRNVFTVVSRI